MFKESPYPVKDSGSLFCNTHFFYHFNIKSDKYFILITTLQEVAKKARVNDFLAHKYKTDYETTVQFLNSSITDIELKQQELLRVNMELERFAHVVSHDLKAPVRGVLSFTGLLEKSLKDNKDERVIEYLQFIKTASRQMNNLIKETLEHSKLGRDEMSIQEVDLQQASSTPIK